VKEPVVCEYAVPSGDAGRVQDANQALKLHYNMNTRSIPMHRAASLRSSRAVDDFGLYQRAVPGVSRDASVQKTAPLEDAYRTWLLHKNEVYNGAAGRRATYNAWRSWSFAIVNARGDGYRCAAFIEKFQIY
jgi:hypothetical protein